MAEFVVGSRRVARETRFCADEVVNAVAVISIWIEGKVLEDRAEPNGSGSELLDVGKLLRHARECSALKAEEVRIVEWLMGGRRDGIIEAIKHQEIDPAVAPVCRRGKRRSGGIGWIHGSVEDRLKICSKERGWHNAPPGECRIEKVFGRAHGILTQARLGARDKCRLFGNWNRVFLG